MADNKPNETAENEPNQLLEFFRAGKDASQFPEITPVKSLEDLRRANTIWLFRGNTVNMVSSDYMYPGIDKGFVTIASRPEDGPFLMFDRVYDPSTQEFIGGGAMYTLMGMGFPEKDLAEGNVYVFRKDASPDAE